MVRLRVVLPAGAGPLYERNRPRKIQGGGMAGVGAPAETTLTSSRGQRLEGLSRMWCGQIQGGSFCRGRSTLLEWVHCMKGAGPGRSKEGGMAGVGA